MCVCGRVGEDGHTCMRGCGGRVKSECVDMLLRYSNYKKNKFCSSTLYMYMYVSV